MTISSTHSAVITAANGTDVEFSFDFKLVSASDMAVYLGDEYVEPTEYTVTIDEEEEGGYVTFNTAPLAGELVKLKRLMTFDQGTEYPVAGPFPAQAHEAALDKLTMICQQLQREIEEGSFEDIGLVSLTAVLSSAQAAQAAAEEAAAVAEAIASDTITTVIGETGEIDVDDSVDNTVTLSLSDTYKNAVNAAIVGKNLLDNARGTINQRTVSGTVVRTAGKYGHDRFKGGDSGCTYTFTESSGRVTFTNSAGSLIQVVPGDKISGGTYILTWEGTAQARVDGGTYGDSGMTFTLTAGVAAEIEFGVGTFRLPQLEKGTVAHSFDWRDDADEEAVCRRYYECNRYGSGAPNAFHIANAGGGSSTRAGLFIPFAVSKKAAPTMTFYNLSGTAGTVTRCNIFGVSVDTAGPSVTSTKTGYNIQAVVDTTVSGFKWYWEASDEP